MKNPNINLRRGIRLAAGLLSAIAVGVINLHATDRTWSGAGDGTTMNSGANWIGGVAPAAPDALFFGGTTGLTPNNNYAANTIFNSITFNSGAGSFVLSGNAINLTNNVAAGVITGITNSSANPQTISLNIALNGTNRYWNLTGDLTNSGSVNSSGSSQTAPRIIKSGPGTLTLAGATDNAFLAVTIDQGKVVLAKTANGALGGYSQINSGGTMVIALVNQIFNRTRLNVEGGTLQVQATETIHCLSSTNVPAISYAGIVENGLANTTNTLQVGSDNGTPHGVYNGTIRDGLASSNVLNLIASRGTLVQTLNGTNTYSGTTAITGSGTVPARLLINGAHVGGGAYAVSGSATSLGELGGSGSISASVVNINGNGAISPGGICAEGDANVFADTTAVLTFSNAVNLNAASSTLEVQLNGATAGTSYDQVNIAGSGTFSNNAANLKLALGYSPVSGDKLTLVKVQGTNSANTVGAFALFNGIATDLSQGAVFVEPVTGKRFQISYRAEGSTFDMGAGNGNDIMLQALPDASGSITWRGNGGNNFWDYDTTADWVNTNNVAVTFTNNPVVFDNSGASNLTVNLTAAVTPPSAIFNSTSNYVIWGSGNISGTVVVTKTNTGTAAIVNENTGLTGTTVIKQGVFQIGTNDTTGSWSGTITVNSNGVLAFDRSDDVTLAMNFSGTGSFLHNGSGALIINTTIPFTGRSTNSGGVFQLGNGSGNAGAIGGDVHVDGTNLLRYYYGANATINNGFSGNGTVLWDTPSTPIAFSLPTTTSNVNFTGTHVLNPGAQVHAVNDNVGYSLGNGSTVIVTNPVTQIWLDRCAVPYNQSFILAGTGSILDPQYYGAMKIFQCTVSGPIALAGDTRIGGSSLGGTLTGQITGNGYQLEVYGDNNVGFPFVLSVSNILNNWGNTLITWGSLRALSAGAISTNSMTIDLNGQLHVFGNTVNVNNLQNGGSGAGVVYNMNTGAAGTIVVGADGSSSTFDGTFGDGASRSLNLTKVGAGTLTLSATSTNTGTVSVNGGTLALTGSGSFNNATNLAVASGATLDVTSRGDGTLTLTANQTLKHSGAPVGTITIAGSLNMGSGILQLALNRANTPATNDSLAVSGSLTGGGTLTVTNLGPALHVNDSFKLFSSGVSGFAYNLQTTDTANNVTYTWNNTVSSDGKITVASVTPLVNTNAPRVQVSVTGNILHFGWPTNIGWTLLTNSVGLTATNQWFPYVNSANLTNVDITINPAKPNMFFKLVYPYP